MGGLTFENTKTINSNEYNEIIQLLNNYDFLSPFRLGNKKTFNDIDLIVSNTEPIINLFHEMEQINEIKTIPLFDERFNLYSKHILTKNLIQIDLLKSWNTDSMEISRAYFSYSFANVFLKQLTNIVNRNFKFSYLGLLCSSNKIIIPLNIKFIQVDNCTRLIIDCDYVFKLLDLDYNIYKSGFNDEVELLNYFSKSKYFSQIQFKNNSKFKHDYKRLKPFANLVDMNLIKLT